MWGSFAQDFCDFLSKCADHVRIIVVVQLGMMKMWYGNFYFLCIITHKLLFLSKYTDIFNRVVILIIVYRKDGSA